MELGNHNLTSILRYPYLSQEHYLHHYPNLRLTDLQKSEMLKVHLKRNKIINQNSKKVFNHKFLTKYRHIVKDTNYNMLRIVGPICIQYGFELNNPHNWTCPLNVLQIGCGPWYNDKLNDGVKLDEKLRELGANVTNLDLNELSSHYPNNNFIQGSWLELEKYFKKEQFHVVFMDNMDPAISFQIHNHYTSLSIPKSFHYQNLLLKTMSHVKRKGLVLFGVTGGASFMMPEYVNDLIELDSIDSTYLLAGQNLGGVQIYRKRG